MVISVAARAGHWIAVTLPLMDDYGFGDIVMKTLFTRRPGNPEKTETEGEGGEDITQVAQNRLPQTQWVTVTRIDDLTIE